jgi:AcrR family transcriptional regulator
MENNNVNELIKEKSKKLFFSYGLKSVSMDDVAKLSGISKKTIYHYFEDKNALVRAIVNDLIQAHERLLKACHNTAKDAIDEVIMQDTGPVEIWTAIRPGFFNELEKFYCEVWQELEQYRQKMLGNIMRNLEWGKEEGVYRNCVNVAFIAELRLQQLINFLQPQFVATQKWSIHQTVAEFTKLYLHSITSERGKKLLYNYLEI